MWSIALTPGEGVGPVKLGMTEEEVGRAIGALHELDRSLSRKRIEQAIMVEYHPQTHTVHWIGINDTLPFVLSFAGLSLFNESVESIRETMIQLDSVDKEDREYGYSFRYLNIGIGFWRENKSEELMEELAGAPAEDRQGLREDLERSKHFQQIALFSERYWQEN